MVGGLGVEPGDRALDVAAGTGSITRALVGAGASVVSLDQSAAMLSRAAGDGAAAVRAGAERLPFEAGSFDLVTFGYLLRYVDDLPAAMTELTRVLRPGGGWGWSSSGAPPACGRARGGCTPGWGSPSPER